MAVSSYFQRQTNTFHDTKHSDLIVNMPSCFKDAPWIEVEAKQKERAILKLRQQMVGIARTQTVNQVAAIKLFTMELFDKIILQNKQTLKGVFAVCMIVAGNYPFYYPRHLCQNCPPSIALSRSNCLS